MDKAVDQALASAEGEACRRLSSITVRLEADQK
jgi:hypothetical protein